MNPIIEVLRNKQISGYTYRYIGNPDSILSVYYSIYRVTYYNNKLLLYKTNEGEFFYEHILTVYDHMEDDEYFNLSVLYGIPDAFMKKNLDIIKDMLDNELHQGLHTISIESDTLI